jgi:hypothetical protein
MTTEPTPEQPARNEFYHAMIEALSTTPLPEERGGPEYPDEFNADHLKRLHAEP